MSAKKILHMIPYQKAFTQNIIDYLNEIFPQQENIFYVFSLENDIHIDSTNVIIKKHSFYSYISALAQIYNADGVIFHSLFFRPYLYLILLLFYNKHSMFNWLIFGADIYYVRQVGHLDILRKFIIWLKKLSVRRFGYITVLTHGDYRIAQKYFDVQGNPFLLSYGNPISLKETLTQISMSESNDQDGTTIKIQIGNSASETNHHIEVLNTLRKFKDKNIKIYAPLSYGDKIYAEKVILIGKKLYGDKFIPLTEFVPFDRYLAYLKTINVAIFNNDRQQALGNISLLCIAGAKVYLRTDTSMWSHYRETMSVKFSEYCTISSQSFEEFINYKKEIRNRNIKHCYDYLTDIDRVRGQWRDIYTAMHKH